MKKYFTNMLRPALFILAATLALPAFAANNKEASEADKQRQKVSADKKLLVANNMKLADAEAKAFWPIYDAYQKDLEQIDERLAKVINDYTLAYKKGGMPNDMAKKLLDEAIAVELDEVKLKQSYVSKLAKVLPAAKVAHYIQVENKIRAILRYGLALSIPMVE